MAPYIQVLAWNLYLVLVDILLVLLPRLFHYVSPLVLDHVL